MERVGEKEKGKRDTCRSFDDNNNNNNVNTITYQSFFVKSHLQFSIFHSLLIIKTNTYNNNNNNNNRKL